jgi:hypothetical protein
MRQVANKAPNFFYSNMVKNAIDEYRETAYSRLAASEDEFVECFKDWLLATYGLQISSLSPKSPIYIVDEKRYMLLEIKHSEYST